MRQHPRAALYVLLPLPFLLLLAACSEPVVTPSLSQVAAGEPNLTSFVALADALVIDLDAVEGNVTVFAPSNDLLDAYAADFGFEDAADLLEQIDDLTDPQFYALRAFVLAHLPYFADGLMTEQFLTQDVIDLVQDKEGTDRYYQHDYYAGSYNAPVIGERDAPFYAYPYMYVFYVVEYQDYDPDELYLLFYGNAAMLDGAGSAAFQVTLYRFVFLAADLAFDKGIVHVIDAALYD